MGNVNLKNVLFAILGFVPLLAFGQPNDCRRAIVICDDRPFSFTPKFGAGLDDFVNLKNDPGCLERRENISVWFYFEFRKDMPPHSGISFTLSDSVLFKGQDYDFALYGPNPSCDSLGKPLRCSFAQISPNQTIIRTGLGRGARDTTEGLDGDGFVDSLIVQPGQGFYLLVDFFVGLNAVNFDSAVAESFRLTWGGTAAPYLNCIANPNCELVKVDAGQDTAVCAGSSLDLKARYSNANGGEKVRWIGLDNTQDWIEDPDSVTTRLRIPKDATGVFHFVFLMVEGNCVHSDTLSLQVHPSPLPEISGRRTICPGLLLTLRSSPEPGSYRWSDGSTADSIRVSAPGVYGLTVTNGLGCTGVDTFLLTEKILPTPQISGDSILCPDETTELSTDLGYASYQWSNGDTSRVISVDSGGLYRVTLTDEEGCSVVGVRELISIVPVQPPVQGPTYFCTGESVLLRTLPGYISYQWSNGGTADSVRVSTSGSLRLSVVDTFGCTAETQVQVSERANPRPVITGKRGFCTGESTTLSVGAGFQGYQWSDGSRDSTLLVARPGTYALTVTDSLGCQGTTFAQVDSLPLPKPNLGSDIEFCEGEIRRITPGLFAAYLWSTGEVFPDILVQRGGVYSVTVTSVEGCKATDSIQVVVNPKPLPLIRGATTLCPDSLVLLSVSPIYRSYRWSTMGTSPILLAGQEGEYRITVTDAKGCRGEALHVLREAPRPFLEIAGPSQVCEGVRVVWQATPGYVSYQWSNGTQTDSLSLQDLKGSFSLVVTDSLGCRAQATKEMTLLDNPVVEIAGASRFCAGDSTVLRVPAGYSQYSWSTGTTDSLLVARFPGMYGVTVTAANGCKREDSILLQRLEPVLTALQPGEFKLCTGDTARFDAGPGFVSYRWSNGSSSPSIEVYEQGQYALTVVDSNFCTSSVTIQVALVSKVKPTILGPPSFCSGQQVQLIAGGGEYERYRWSSGDSTAIVNISKGGMYRLTVTDRNGCIQEVGKEIEEKPVPSIAISGKLWLCRNDTTVLSVPSGFTNYTWTNGSQDTAIVVFEPGPYGILAFAPNGCAVSDQVNIVLSRIPYPVIEGDRLLCSRDSVVLEVAGGFPSYQWTTGEQTNRIVVRREDTYGVTVNDELGCTGFARIKVIATDSPEPEIEGDTTLCPGDSSLLRVTGTYADLRWLPDSTSVHPRAVYAPGWYVVEVQAANGCRARDSILLSGLPAPAPKITGDTFFCTDSTARLAVADTFQTITWGNGATTPGIEVTQPGRLSVSVRDEKGCLGTDTFEVAYIERPLAVAGPDTSLTCARRIVPLGAAAQIDTQLYVATWDGPGINRQNSNLHRPFVSEAGSYQLVLRDSRYGCVSLPASAQVLEKAYVPVASAFAEDTLDCATPSVVLNGKRSQQGRQFTYSWRREGQNMLLDTSLNTRVVLPGRYELQVLDTLTGCRGSANAVVAIDTAAPRPAIFGSGTLNCSIDSIILQTSASAGQQYAWAFQGLKTPYQADLLNWTAKKPGTYILEALLLRNGCVGRDSVEIGLDTLKPMANASLDREIDCNLNEVTLFALAPNPAWMYQWRDMANQFILSRTDSLKTDLPGSFLLEVINPVNGCIGRDTARALKNSSAPVGFTLALFPETCVGRRDGRVSVEAVSGGASPFIFRLGEAEGYVPGKEFKNLAPGNYRLTVQDANGCEHTGRFDIAPGFAATLDLGPDRYISLGDRVRLTAVTNIPANAIAALKWTQPDTLGNLFGATLDVQPLQTSWFAAVVRDTNGCTALDSVQVFVERSQRLYIPNAFSPNNDGTNDVFMLFSGPEVLRIRTIQVFDRWGILVFEKQDFIPNDPVFGWDGTYRGVLQNPGVYVFHGQVEYLDGRVERFKGDVTLIR
jgi:gliding motility-associated-like protein